MSDSSVDERRFLHDISTPLGIAMGYAEMIHTDLSKKGEVCADELKKFEKIEKSLHALQHLLEERRKIVKAQSLAATST